MPTEFESSRSLLWLVWYLILLGSKSGKRFRSC